jgi:hypothetical protein
MTESSVIQYVGFRASISGREYAFSVREAGAQSREYTLTIANEAFESHRARYQDGPEICSLRLHRELAISTTDPATTHFGITDTELASYGTHKPKPRNHLQSNSKTTSFNLKP